VTPRRTPLIAIAAVTLSAAPAGAVLLSPIDDCERGAFSLQTNQGAPLQTVAPIPGHASHAIASQRTVTVAAANQPGPFTYAGLSPGPGDSHLSLSVARFGYCDVEYDWGVPKDLTFGGTMQWIEMDVFAPHPNDQVTMTVRDGAGQTTGSRFFQFGGRETLLWGAGSLNASVLSQATSVTFHFHPGQNGTSFLVYDVRFRTTGSVPVSMAGETVAVQTPPVPSAPLRFTPLGLSPAGPLYRAEVAIDGATTDAMVVPAADWTWSKAAGTGGEWAEMSFRWTEPGGVQETDLRISVDVSEMDGGCVPEIYPPDPIHDAQSILLHFPVALRTGAGGPVQALSDTWLSLDVVEGQGLEIGDVSVAAGPAAASWTGGFTLSFRLQLASGEAVDDQDPLLTAAWISDLAIPATTAAPLPPDPAEPGPLRLIAAPSVTRGGTEIRAGRPFEAATAILIHDVAGRIVTRLPAAPGAASVRWDGHGRDGRPAPAGVYFARAEASRAGAARIIRVR
jgi:hypothetical protein